MKTVTAASALLLSLTLGTDAYAAKAPAASGGTVINDDYTFKNDNFGKNDVLNMGVTVAQNSEPAAAKNPPLKKPIESIKTTKQAAKAPAKKGGKRGLYERNSENWSIYIRDADGEHIYERNAYPEAYPKKKAATTSGGNNVQNSYNLNGDTFGSNSNFNMQSTTAINGGNTASVNVNADSSKKKGGKRWLYESQGLEIRDFDDSLYERDAEPAFEGYLYERDLLERGGLLSGGDAKGGDSRTKGGNSSKNQNTINKTNLRGNGQIINMSSSTAQRGGNTVGGPGGANSGNGGKGGGFSYSASVQMPPIPRKRWLQAREAELDAREAELDLYERDLLERGGLLSGGNARGGNSKTEGGNSSNNKNTIGKTNLKGNGQIINMSSATSQSGGNTQGKAGGMNTGSGGAGGSAGFSANLQLPPIPMRRWVERRDAFPEELYFEERDAEAYPEELYFEERDAEPEYQDWYHLYARDAYPEAEAEADAEAEFDFDFDGLYAREAESLDEYDY
ncbi:hypothetical protein MMC13_007335 [Lambiella insularis]|nr:hypothetical protein [Lambiella insularis]